MTESKHMERTLLTENSEEFDTLLGKGELLSKSSIYDLKKIPGVSATDSDDSIDLPSTLTKGLNEVLSDEVASPQSERGFLPATLRAAISVTNIPPMIQEQDRINALCDSPPLEKTKKKKKPSMRRTKSDKTRKLNIEKDLERFHRSGPLDFSDRTSKSEDLRKLRSRNRSELDSPKSESLHQRRTTSSRREKEKKRRSNSGKGSATKDASKTSSSRRTKESRSRAKKNAALLKSSESMEADDRQVVNWERKSSKKPDSIEQSKQRSSRPKREPQPLDTYVVDTQFVEWKRTISKKLGEPIMQSENREARPKRKPKKSRSAGSNSASTSVAKARRPRSRQARSLSRSRDGRTSRSSSKTLTVSVERTKKVKKDKTPSPHQLQKKRVQKNKQAKTEKKKEKTEKAIKSTDDSPQQPISRRTLMLTSKAKTSSCRDLLRKISKMNDDRILEESKSKIDLMDQYDESMDLTALVNFGENSELLDQSSRSTPSMTRTKTNSEREESYKLDETNKTSCSSIKAKAEYPESPEPTDDNEKREKPPRTRSAPLKFMLKSNAKLSRSSSNNSLTRLSISEMDKEKANLPQKRSMFQKFGHKSLNLTEKFGPKSFNRSLNLAEKFGPKSMNRSLNLTDQLQKFVKSSGKNKNSIDGTKKDRPKTLQKSESDSTLGLPKKKKKKNARKQSSQYDLMLSMHSTDEHFDDCGLDSGSDGELSFSEEDVDDVGQELDVSLETKSVSLRPSRTIDVAKEEGESTDNVAELTQKKTLGDHVKPLTAQECDDILSMAEFSLNSQIPKPSSCLQIDFSQFSDHGTPLVKEKKVAKRGNRSSRGVRTMPSQAVKAA